MTRIQFGWSLPSGPPQGMSRNAYMEGVHKGFELIKPLVQFCCPLWETSRRWLSGSRKVGFLHHILGIHCAAKHAVGDAKEVGAVAFKILCW